MIEHLFVREHGARGEDATMDEAALVALYEQHADAVRALAHRITASAQGAEEVTQDVFMRLWTRWEDFDPDRGSIQTFLRLLCHATAVGWVRREASQRRRAERFGELVARTDVPDSEFDEVENRLMDVTRRKEVQEALDTLPQEQRAALVLVYVAGMTHTTAAAALGIPLGTAKTRIRAGLRRMSAHVDLAS